MTKPTVYSAPGELIHFPPGLHNAFLFAAFNALSYQVVLASPMILYSKSLGASATVLGLIAGMMPLLVIFQIPASSHINRVGYRRFVLAGWSTRVLFIFIIALVPLTGAFLTAPNQLALLLVLLFGFNLSRGISSCAWMPWITALVPPDLRGKYLVRDVAVQNVASFVAFLASAAVLAGETKSWQFALIFFFSATMGVASLLFLKRIPDVPPPDEPSVSTTRVPWLKMANHPPFRKLLHMVVAWSVASGGITAFTVAFLRTESGMAEGKILLVSSAAFIGGLSSLWFLGSHLDRLGSKPVLGFTFAAWAVVLLGWTVLAGRMFPTGIVVVLIMQFIMGLLGALVSMANTRLAMAVVPVMGRNHFFAIYSVVTNVTLGLSPIAWGVLIDTLGSRSPVWLGLEWNRYAIFFSGAAAAFGVALLLARRLEEPQAASLEELLREVLIQSPQRFWLRFWPRG